MTKFLNIEVTEIDDPRQPDKKNKTTKLFLVSNHFVPFWSLSIYDFEPEKIKCYQVSFSTV